jgi:uncharacterized protein with HEPN domain
VKTRNLQRLNLRRLFRKQDGDKSSIYESNSVGENVKLLPVEIKQKHRQIPWSRMKSTRNFVAHEYPKIEFKDI